MTDLPILFSAPMVRALLDGRKTQTRRVLKPQPSAICAGFQKVFVDPPHFEAIDANGKPCNAFAGKLGVHPYPPIRFANGDRLWVRENLWLYGRWRQEGTTPKGRPRQTLDLIGKVAAFEKPADIAYYGGKEGFAFRPGIHMPRWASRLTLTVTDVRVQRLQECSREDAIAEGIQIGRPLPEVPDSTGDIYHDGVTDPIDGWTRNPITAYANLWDHINGAGAWAANPWIVAVSFSVERRNIDAARAA